ncbi:MAG: hypothetical protein ACOC4H_00015 [bacterium]
MRLEHPYIPLFVFLTLLFSLICVKRSSPKILLLSFICCFTGLFTYASFVLIIPVVLYLFFEYRKEISRKFYYSAQTAFSLLLIFFIIVNLLNGHTVSWALSQTSGGSGGFSVNPANIFIFLTQPLLTSNAFIKSMPILNFAECLFLLGGLVLLLNDLKNKTSRIILAGFFFSLFTFAVSSSLDHHWRHIMLLPFIIIISGIFTAELLNRRGFYILLIFFILLSINTSFRYFTQWGTQNNNPPVYKKIAQHINSRCKNCMVIHELLPYGLYEVYLRTKSAYNIPEDPEKVFILAPYTYKKTLLNIFKNADTHFFYNTKAKPVRAFVLIEHNISSPEESDAFLDLKRSLSLPVMYMWDLNYEKVLLLLKKTEPGKGSIGSIQNLSLYLKGLEAFSHIKNRRNMNKILHKFEKNMIKPPEYFYYKGLSSLQSGDLPAARLFFEKNTEFIAGTFRTKDAFAQIKSGINNQSKKIYMLLFKNHHSAAQESHKFFQ